MKNLIVFAGVLIGLFFVSPAYGQTPIQFAKGTSEKTLTITVKAKSSNKYTISVRKGQVINIEMDGDISISKEEQFPVVYASLLNGKEGVDQSQDGEAYLSILAGRNAAYLVEIGNSDTKRTRTFKVKVSVSDKREDFAGGEPVDQ